MLIAAAKKNATPNQRKNKTIVASSLIDGQSRKFGASPSGSPESDPTRPHHRMVTLAQSSPGDRPALAHQAKTTTVMLERDDFSSNRHPL